MFPGTSGKPATDPYLGGWESWGGRVISKVVQAQQVHGLIIGTLRSIILEIKIVIK